jgi:hypothetical protein
MRRRRFRTFAKWACTLAAVVAVGLAVFSRYYTCEWEVVQPAKARSWNVAFGGGLIWFMGRSQWQRVQKPVWFQWRMSRCHAWHWGRSGELAQAGSDMDWHAGILWSPYDGGSDFGLSALYPVLITGAPAAVLWYVGRRRFGPGQCKKCGYERSGLAADAACPECGTVPARG